MTSFEAIAPALGLLGLFLLFIPFLPAERSWTRNLVLCIALLILLRYLHWRFFVTVAPADFTSIDGIWIMSCFIVEALAFVDTAISFCTMARTSDRSPEADRHEARLRALSSEHLPSVDVLIPTYNEDLEVLERSIVGAINLDYPRFTVWVLDDGKRDWLRDFCADKGARYIRRPTNEHAKAGNINHALEHISGQFIAVFDADFVPHRNFLYRTVGFFDDPRIGCVQTPQNFFNKDPIQINLGLDNAWPEEQRFFFDVVMPARDAWDCAFCCGSCSITRREALLRLGGMPTQSVTEDILSTLAMLRFGFVTRYLRERLSVGLSPESIDAFFVQRKRWCRGAIQMLFLRDGPLGPGLSLLQRVLFLPSYWLIQLPTRVAAFLIPLAYMWLGLAPLYFTTTEDLLYYQLPVFVSYIFAMRWLAPGAYLPLVTTASNLFIAFRVVPTALASLLRPFGQPFKVTPKGSSIRAPAYDRTTLVACGGLLLATMGGIAINLDPELRIVRDSGFFPIAAMWGILNAIILFLTILLCFGKPRRRVQERFRVDEAAVCTVTHERRHCRVRDISLSGVRVVFGNQPAPGVGSAVALELPGVGLLTARVVRVDGFTAGLHFERLPAAAKEGLLALVTDLARSAPDRRRAPRRVKLHEPVNCLLGDGWHDCRVVDISLGGALIDFGA